MYASGCWPVWRKQRRNGLFYLIAVKFVKMSRAIGARLLG